MQPLPANLIESELFGHEKRLRLRERTPSGLDGLNLLTAELFFLDEISEIEVGLQAKLLRVLQERELETGWRSSKTIKVDVRILASTNRDLKEAIQQGRLSRRPLFSFKCCSYHSPAFERALGRYYPLLADHFLNKYVKENKKERIKNVFQGGL